MSELKSFEEYLENTKKLSNHETITTVTLGDWWAMTDALEAQRQAILSLQKEVEELKRKSND